MYSTPVSVVILCVVVASGTRGDMEGLELKNWCYDRCVSEWGQWSTCTAACGGGTQSRARSHMSIQWCPQISCPHALSEQRSCNEGCNNGGVASGSGSCDCPPTHQGNCCDRERKCDYPGSMQNGAVEGRWPSLVGEVTFFSCREGHHLVGSDYARCTSTGWSHDTPTCEMEQSCRALTAGDAPVNGALICMYLAQANMRYCAVRANDGYEHPSEVDDYETCDACTNFHWSYQTDDPDAVFPPRIRLFFPGLYLQADIFYLPTGCTDLTSTQQEAAKTTLVEQFNNDSICQNKIGRPCSNSDLTILCGATTD